MVNIFPRLLRSGSLIKNRLVTDDMERQLGGIDGLELGRGEVGLEEVLDGEAAGKEGRKRQRGEEQRGMDRGGLE
jgi:hypothetical protein